MTTTPRPPGSDLDARFIELFDQLWNDPRRRDDRAEFSECASCGRAVRWIANLGSATGSALQVVARPVATAAFYDPASHAGLVAVFRDRTGFTVSRFTAADEVEDAFLYECHWDVCDDARALRDRISRDRRSRSAGLEVEHLHGDPDTLLRYAAWRDTRTD